MHGESLTELASSSTSPNRKGSRPEASREKFFKCPKELSVSRQEAGKKQQVKNEDFLIQR
jgi:hypothetical protein